MAKLLCEIMRSCQIATESFKYLYLFVIVLVTPEGSKVITPETNNLVDERVVVAAAAVVSVAVFTYSQKSFPNAHVRLTLGQCALANACECRRKM